MRLLARFSVLFLAMGQVRCANVPATDLAPSPVVTVACTDSVGSEQVWLLDWELIISTDGPIESGEVFKATLGGFAVISESLLAVAQAVVPGGISEVNLVDLNATVHVRSGAAGPDVVLHPELMAYECFSGGGLCQPDNDVRDDPTAAPGLQGNADCEPVGPANPCVRPIPVPTSTECAEDCAAPHKAVQCELYGFCITGDLRVPLQTATQRYTAGEQGKVLFGWADESTGATIKEDDPNWGTWMLPKAVYAEGPGPVGFRANFGGALPVAFECAMGVDSTGPLGVDSTDPLSSPTPDDALISLPIQTESF